MMKKFIYGGIAATAGLLAGVFLFDLLNEWSGQDISPGKNYAQEEILWGIVAETIRGFLLSYLYLNFSGAGSSYGNAIKFGLITSLLVGSLWVVLGHFYYKTDFVNESLIILLQGLLSGIALGLVFVRK